jgi:GT2 family glycosyltransferase
VTAGDVTCVVVAFHRPRSLAELLAGLAGDRGPAVVVVNVDDDPAVARVAAEHGADTVALAGNPGYAAAVNAGAARATSEVVVFMNDDLVVDAATVDALAAVVSSGRAEVAVPAIVDGDGVVERTIAAVPSVRSLALEWMALPDRPVWGLRLLRVQKWRQPQAPERVDAATAAIVAVATSILRQRPLPEQYFLYWEESEWFWWLRRDGRRVEYHPELRAAHVGGRADVRPEKCRLLARNAVRCIRRTHGRAAAARAWPVVVAWQLRLALVDGVRCAGRPDGRRRAVLRARWAGLRGAVASSGEIWGAR